MLTPEPYKFIILRLPMNSDTDIQEKLSRVSQDPGVYLMKDADGEIIYIGKARNLKKRLVSYFKNSG